MGKTSLYLAVLLSISISPAYAKTAKAYFAGGCFWCMEGPFEKLEGVSEVYSGYAGGSKANPNYKEVASGKTKHREAVVVHYDPEKISYKNLLFIFWQQIDPTDANGQFVDKGFQYSSAIFYNSAEEKKWAEESLQKLKALKVFDEKIVTPIVAYSTFYRAEDNHQDYYKNNPLRYWYYRNGSGRDQFLKKKWTNENKKKWQESMSAKVEYRK